jgi:membrane protein implicated in regulation of membrane protease activity
LTLRTYRNQTITGKEDLIGKTVLVKETLNPEGTVVYEGDLWTAASDSGAIESGEEVIITEVKGLKLFVKKK